MTVEDLLRYIRDNDVPGDAKLVIGRWPKRIGERALDQGETPIHGKRDAVELSLSVDGDAFAILYEEQR